MIRSCRFFLLVLLVVPSQSLATEGVFEINEACIAGGCFPGDPAGLPIQITSPGSYRLTSNIALPTPASTAIFVRAENVTVDLNGFEIRGTNTCSISNGDLACTHIALGYGVFTDLNIVRTEVRNGSIVGVGFTGVHLGDHSIVRDLRVAWSGAGGVRVGAAGVVRECVVYQNWAGFAPGSVAGIEATQGARITRNSSYQNGGDGIKAVSGALVEGNVVYENDDRGITVGNGSSVLENLVYQNGDHGISADGSATISRNSVTSNGHDGIFVQNISGFGSTVADNLVRQNGTNTALSGIGLNLPDFVTYSGNTVTSSHFNQVVGGVNRGGNYCVGTGTMSADCP